MSDDSPSQAACRAKHRTYSGQQAFAHAAHQARVMLSVPEPTERDLRIPTTKNLMTMAHEQATADIELLRKRCQRMGPNPVGVVNPEVLK